MSTKKRLAVSKTYKLYLGGKFPRTESGRYYELKGRKDTLLANVSRASRKDFRNAVVAARKAWSGWAATTACLRGQILYRVAEMLEGRAGQFEEELRAQGATPVAARKEVTASVDLFVHYAGWSDKYQSLFSSVNPVATPHFNFSMPESTGVVAAVAPEGSGLLGLSSVVAPILVGGNTSVILASHARPLCAITLAEVLNSSDVPGGTVNILTGLRDELLPQFAEHMDVNALLVCSDEAGETRLAQERAAENVKRVIPHADAPLAESPYHILDLQEIKTTWHPVGV
ncbi:MAG: aldehyde dehydrogenase [Roseibacillus sp.]|jgi:acyl-CoA reductase-like NAD-dependent aldehyde dehydrogenase|nr:aldehyde dehydrogenase [Roseibacillus sp.]MBP34542.1 aldehyde dehydrogenase [Roseibacillus sp.]MCP4729869.1 aldehyde dehydrogenase [Roseibacillus sp.]MDP6208514.1 aldehyde dehydrogenase family protein [Roseibacillus sp.]MDP7308954.1 aldehyde dehydrogenase family protein [Roseibacillus sp.]|tara:strand:+ start:4822 stop:5679 length:858 start_codon:yes stop_codon:yes gene_type:complete